LMTWAKSTKKEKGGLGGVARSGVVNGLVKPRKALALFLDASEDRLYRQAIKSGKVDPDKQSDVREWITAAGRKEFAELGVDQRRRWERREMGERVEACRCVAAWTEAHPGCPLPKGWSQYAVHPAVRAIRRPRTAQQLRKAAEREERARREPAVPQTQVVGENGGDKALWEARAKEDLERFDAECSEAAVEWGSDALFRRDLGNLQALVRGEGRQRRAAGSAACSGKRKSREPADSEEEWVSEEESSLAIYTSDEEDEGIASAPRPTSGGPSPAKRARDASEVPSAAPPGWPSAPPSVAKSVQTRVTRMAPTSTLDCPGAPSPPAHAAARSVGTTPARGLRTVVPETPAPRVFKAPSRANALHGRVSRVPGTPGAGVSTPSRQVSVGDPFSTRGEPSPSMTPGVGTRFRRRA